MTNEILIRHHPLNLEEKTDHRGVQPTNSKMKYFECGEFRHESFKCLKRKNKIWGTLIHLEPEGTLGDVVNEKIYATFDRVQVEYRASLLQAESNMSGQPYTFWINTRSTHSFISSMVVVDCKLHQEAP